MTLLKLTRKGTITKKSFRTKKNTNNDEGVVDDETSSFSSEEKVDYDKSSTMSEKPQDVSNIEKSDHKPAVRVSTITVSTKTASVSEKKENRNLKRFIFISPWQKEKKKTIITVTLATLFYFCYSAKLLFSLN